MMRPPFVPSPYASSQTQHACIWRHPDAPRPDVCDAEFDELVVRIQQLLDFELSCALHVVVYHSNQQARTTLERPVPGNQLLAPLLGQEVSVIACQSAEVDAANGDARRMRRHLAHELAHVAAILQTGSEKRLGDGNEQLYIAPWVNEGFAECVAAEVAARPELLQRAAERAHHGSIDTSALDDIFNQLNAPGRREASALATTLVSAAIQRHGLARVFLHLDQPSKWLS